jgi:hypothetical protein
LLSAVKHASMQLIHASQLKMHACGDCAAPLPPSRAASPQPPGWPRRSPAG